jgi:hypothetical protein
LGTRQIDNFQVSGVYYPFAHNPLGVCKGDLTYAD